MSRYYCKILNYSKNLNGLINEKKKVKKWKKVTDSIIDSL